MKQALVDEELLVRALSADVGVAVDIPVDPFERWSLIRALMNVRGPTDISSEVLEAQDRVLGRILNERGIVDADDFEYIDGIALWQGDITRLRCDAIVNAANSGMLGCFQPCHACIDNAIHTFAGIQLRLECARMMQGGREPTGRARMTGAYNLPCEHVIHTVGPIVSGKLTSEHEQLLRSCYRSCLELAGSEGLGTVAFCCISTGEFRFPRVRAAEIAVEEVRSFLADNDDMRVIFDVFTDDDLSVYREILGRC